MKMDAVKLFVVVLLLSLCDYSHGIFNVRRGGTGGSKHGAKAGGSTGGLGGLFMSLGPGFRQTTSYKAAVSLGCKYPIDSESILRFIMPRGCERSLNICPFMLPRKRSCVKAGVIGMCCPVYVTDLALKSAVMMRKYKKFAEMFLY